MHFSTFQRKLKRLNPKIRIIPGPNKAWGIYVPTGTYDPDTHGEGLRWVAGMTSPKFTLGVIPKQNFVKPAPEVFGVKWGKPEWFRGWKATLRQLVDTHAVRRSDALREFSYYLVSL
jgi:hypothetical protein